MNIFNQDRLYQLIHLMIQLSDDRLNRYMCQLIANTLALATVLSLKFYMGGLCE